MENGELDWTEEEAVSLSRSNITKVTGLLIIVFLDFFLVAVVC